MVTDSANNGAGEENRWDSVRSEAIRRARQLLQDPDYPPKEVLGAIAETLAGHLALEKKKTERDSSGPSSGQH